MKVRTSLVVGLAATVVIGGSVAAVWIREDVRERRVTTAASVAQARAVRTSAVVAVAPAPMPTKLPLLGPEGLDPDGYPLAYVDQPGLRSLLWHHEYEKLDAYFTAYQEAFEADPKHEYWPIDAGEAFTSADAELDQQLDRWVTARPDSFAAYLARGTHEVSVGYARRGGKYAPETAKADMTAMEDAHARAAKDLERALALRPKLVAALRGELRLAGAHASRADEDALEAEAARLCPACFLVKVTYIMFLRPRWGGSYAAIHAYAAKHDPKVNPRFRLLDGYVDWDQSDVLRYQDKLPEAQAAINRAIALGDHWEFLLERAQVRLQRNDDVMAQPDLDKALQLRPGHPEILFARARALRNQMRAEEAGKDLLAGLRVDATNVEARELVPYVVNGLMVDGWAFHKAGKRDDALRLFDLASEIAPSDPEVIQRRSWIIVGTDNPDIPALEAAAAKNPDDLRLHQQLDYSLALKGNYARVVEMWTEYLSRHPDDARAYLERSGAYHHLGKRAEMRADLVKSCDLGLNEGCQDLKRYGGP